MKVTVIGAGYVGLVTGACLAEMGNAVTCIDVDRAKIDNLKNGIIPIHEPGLDVLVRQNTASKRLWFATSLSDPEAESEIYLIAVGTPPGEDGSADLSHVLRVACDLGRHISRYTVVVDKSTVPVGTADTVRAAIRKELESRGVKIPFDVVSNPEFLKEGAAVEDFMKPDRIVVGAESERAREIMRELYAPFMRSHERVLFMGVKEAEMTKYAANAILATKISFMNEIAGLCDRMGVDVESVRVGIGSDSRIGYAFIYPGAGYGGSCFPKDVKALIHMAQQLDFEPRVLKAVEARNAAQKQVLFEKIRRRFGEDLRERMFAIWGLAFKPGTDDMREASAVTLIRALIGAGAKVRAYDPVAMPASRQEFSAGWLKSGQLELVEDQYLALKGADAMVLVTEWKPFRHPDFGRIKNELKNPIVFDGRNQYDPAQLRALGFEYSGIGR
jgi:UDPglucose 6-dehydrogenase